MVEILSAALTGAHFGYEASSFFDAKGPPPRVGQFFFLVDPTRFGGMGFASRVGELAKAVLDKPGTRLPGERRLNHALPSCLRRINRRRHPRLGVRTLRALSGRVLARTRP